MILILLGPPGAGKGTQAARIAGRLGIVHLSSGDILRAERKAKTTLGARAQDFMDRGVLVPDDLILAMMMDHIGRACGEAGCLLDGFPRTLHQARELDRALSAEGLHIDRVIEIRVADEIVIGRLTGRSTCGQCGRIYHREFSPPRQNGVCDDCGGVLTVRRDDHLDVVAQRLRTYHDETRPLVDYYQSSGVLRSVDGVGELDDVTVRIEKACQA